MPRTSLSGPSRSPCLSRPAAGTDTGARLIAQKFATKWGQQVVVDNKGGAARQIGAELVAKTKPDGYTI